MRVDTLRGLAAAAPSPTPNKGTGNGAHDLQNDTVNLIDGLRADAAAAGKRSNFTALDGPSPAEEFDARLRQFGKLALLLA